VLHLFSGFLFAQSNLVHVSLDQWGKDEKFDKALNPIAFYYTKGDSIFAFDMENLKEPEVLIIKRPEGYKSYAYGFVHFTGVANTKSNGMTNLLLVNVDQRDPWLFIDRNNNLDFTDDDKPVRMPGPFFLKDSVLIELKSSLTGGGSIAIKLSRINFMNRYSYKTLLNEYYEFYYKDRKFVGIDQCFREQRYQLRQGVFRTAVDSFKIGVLDVNSNGRYNDKDTDMIITAGYGDSVFDSRDELHSFVIKSDKNGQYLERNGEQYAILQVDPAGKYVVFRQADSTELFDKIQPGKKVPRFSFYDWEGKKHKIRKYRRKQVYIYFTGPSLSGFSKDTAWLRKLAADYKDKIVVIGFIDVNKSYELKIFGTYSNLNWIAAFKDKYTLQKIRLRGLPSSLWLDKKRKVLRYQITPEQLYKNMQSVSP